MLGCHYPIDRSSLCDFPGEFIWCTSSSTSTDEWYLRRISISGPRPPRENVRIRKLQVYDAVQLSNAHYVCLLQTKKNQRKKNNKRNEEGNDILRLRVQVMKMVVDLLARPAEHSITDKTDCSEGQWFSILKLMLHFFPSINTNNKKIVTRP